MDQDRSPIIRCSFSRQIDWYACRTVPCTQSYTRFSQRSRFGRRGCRVGHQNKPIRSSGCKRSGDAGTSRNSSLALIGGLRLNSVTPSTRIKTFGWTDCTIWRLFIVKKIKVFIFDPLGYAHGVHETGPFTHGKMHCLKTNQLVCLSICSIHSEGEGTGEPSLRLLPSAKELLLALPAREARFETGPVDAGACFRSITSLHPRENYRFRILAYLPVSKFDFYCRFLWLYSNERKKSLEDWSLMDCTLPSSLKTMT